MNEELKKALSVRYIKLHFEVEVMENCELPMTKASAIRGGMGQMLLGAHCIRDRNCETCDFRDECVVQRIMYSPFDIKPKFVTEGESAGYVIECEDYRTDFEAGDTLAFTIILFGKAIAHFNPLLQAIHALGQVGLGKEHGRFQIVNVTNSQKESLLYGNSINMGSYDIRTLLDYVEYRRKRSCGTRMRFHSPTSIKSNGQMLKEFDAEAIVRALSRRLYMLDCYEGIETNQLWFDKIPALLDHSERETTVSRYTTRHQQKVHLEGIRGWADFDEVEQDLYDLMLAGEIMHVGKRVSLGFGRYTMVERR